MTDHMFLIKTLKRLNYLRTAGALSMWKGEKPSLMPYRLYENHEQFLKLDTLGQVERIQDEKTRLKLKHAFIDHYLQHALLPHETEMQTWMRGAAALVNDERVYFKNIIQWCQTSSNHSERVILQKETGFKPATAPTGCFNRLPVTPSNDGGARETVLISLNFLKRTTWVR